MNHLSARPTPLATLLDAPFQFVRRDLPELAPWAALIGVIWSSPVLIQQAAASALGGFGASDPMQDLAKLYLMAIVGNAAGLLAAGLYLAGTFAMYHLIYRRLQGEPVTLQVLGRGALDWRLWVTAILVGLVYLASLIGCGLPMLYLAPVLLPCSAVVLHENDPGQAVQRCFQLVHHRAGDVNGWRTWGRLVAVLHVIYFVQTAVASVTMVPTMAVVGVRVWRSLAEGTFTPEMMQTMAFLPLWMQVPLTLVGGALGGLAMLYSVAVLIFVYRDMRDTCEGTDLLRALEGDHRG